MNNLILKKIFQQIDIPASSYESAIRRYQDLEDYLRTAGICKRHKPLVIPQGSFALGTVIRPLSEEEDFDLDLTCKLLVDVSKLTDTQLDIKSLLGEDIENYRVWRGIQSEKEEKHRCWRIEYKEKVGFHMDIVPCIPETEQTLAKFYQRILEEGLNPDLADAISKTAVSITDDRHPEYEEITDDWLSSNPEGYITWFRSRMKLSEDAVREALRIHNAASIDMLQSYKWKTTLQKSVQFLKRHRDVMFKDSPDSKPISIIITTLAGHAYNGENDLEQALLGIVNRMEGFVSSERPRIPNPTNPKEDFADRWGTQDGQRLRLEENFWMWLYKVKADVRSICGSDGKMASVVAINQFGIAQSTFDENPDMEMGASSVTIKNPPKPWCHG